MKSVVRVEVFAGQGGVIKTNKNGVSPVYLKYISGNALPRFSNVQDGTVMANRGFEVGHTYIVDVTPTGEVFGEKNIPQFNISLTQELTAADLITLFSAELSKTVAQSSKVNTTAVAPATTSTVTPAVVEAPATAEVVEG